MNAVNPVQVVAEARDAFRASTSMSRLHERYVPKENAAIVAALKAAGALMPEEADDLRRSNDGVRAVLLFALLQEALSVLGRHTPKPLRTSTGFYVEHCRLSNEPWPCPEASLAEKIEKAIGGEG